MYAPPLRSRWQFPAAVLCAVALAIAVTGCQSVPQKVPSWLWPPPLGVALLRGTVAWAHEDRSADPHVVYLVPVETVVPLPAFSRGPVVHWREGAFEPGSVAVRLDARVRIVNDGALHHRLFTAGRHAIQLDLRPYSSPELHLSGEGPFHIYCSLHPSEYFFVYASQRRYLGTVRSDGSWSIGPVAPGTYHVMVWSPSSSGYVRTVHVWPWSLPKIWLGPEPRRR